MNGTMSGRAGIPMYLTTGQINTITTGTPTTRPCVVRTITFARDASAGQITVTDLASGLVFGSCLNTSISGDQLYDVYCPSGFSYTTLATNPNFTITYALMDAP